MIEIHNQGFTDKDIQVIFIIHYYKLLTIIDKLLIKVKLMIKNLECSKNVLTDDAYEILMSWCKLVSLTLKECQFYNAKENVDKDDAQALHKDSTLISNLSNEQLGMLNFIKGVKQRFQEGYDLQYLLKQQNQVIFI